MTAKRAASRSSTTRAKDRPVARIVELGGEELIVVSVPVCERSIGAEVLTPAERAVAREVLEGHSNAEIARRRNSSPRTVVNQLAAVYRKLGVSSRAELAATWIDDET